MIRIIRKFINEQKKLDSYLSLYIQFYNLNHQRMFMHFIIPVCLRLGGS